MSEPLRIVVASHDFKIFEPIRSYLASLPGVEITEDRWTGTRPGDHDEAESRRLLEWADVVVCEWCQGNAVWYSHNKRVGQRLIVRFHRFEIDNDLPALVDIGAVDLTIFVGDHVRRAASERFGWTGASRLQVVWNGVDVEAFDLPKRPSAETTLGLLGWVPKLKRLDLALDVLEEVRLKDERFRLLVKGKPTWDHPWIWRRERERWYAEDALNRIERSPLLRNSVSIEPFGSVREWFRDVGYILSVSDIEGFHIATAEGMASRAVPIILRWDGADEIYPEEWIYDDASAAAAGVLASNRQERGDRAHAVARARFADGEILRTWRSIVGVPAAEESKRTFESGQVGR
ncbi:MAG TPA: hypothetical protein VGW79_01675 [Actinomycetota bacterium]|nr:hypothetical protein [Actinomycetota bacterium]